MYKNILYPIDIVAQDSWEKSLPIVKEYVSNFNAKLHVMTVIPEYGMSIISQYFPQDTITKMVDKTKAELHKFVEENLSDVDVEDTITAKGASVYQAIIDTADEIDADLIMVSAHRPELKDYLLGPNAAKVVRHSKRSVLVMR